MNPVNPSLPAAVCVQHNVFYVLNILKLFCEATRRTQQLGLLFILCVRLNSEEAAAVCSLVRHVAGPGL